MRADERAAWQADPKQLWGDRIQLWGDSGSMIGVINRQRADDLVARGLAYVVSTVAICEVDGREDGRSQ